MKSSLVSHKLKSSFLDLAGVASVPPKRGKSSIAAFFFLQHKIAHVAIKLVI